MDITLDERAPCKEEEFYSRSQIQCRDDGDKIKPIDVYIIWISVWGESQDYSLYRYCFFWFYIFDISCLHHGPLGKCLWFHGLQSTRDKCNVDNSKNLK